MLATLVQVVHLAGISSFREFPNTWASSSRPKAQHDGKSWEKAPFSVDLVRWQIGHVKTGRPKVSDQIQIMLYMHLLRPGPRASGATITGQAVYIDHVVDIPADAVEERFFSTVRELDQRIAARRVKDPLEEVSNTDQF